MVGYLKSNFDNMWKLCTKEMFYEIANSEAVAKAIAAVRSGDKNAKRKLPAYLFNAKLDEKRYAEYVQKCQANGTKPRGSRCEEFLIPSGFFMMDFDRTEGSAYTLYEKFLQTMRDRGVETRGFLALAHCTPSGHGLRLVLCRRADSTIEADQRWIAGMMQEKIDEVCKDLSRLSYAVTAADIFYCDDELLFSEEMPNADASCRVPTPTILPTPTTPPAAPLLPEGGELSSGNHANAAGSVLTYPTTYNGVAYDVLVEALTEQLGGVPAHGSRNNFIFSMACHLRYVCNDEPEWIEQVLPTYGEEASRVKATIRSACNRAQSKNMPQLMQRAMQVAKTRSIVNMHGMLLAKVPPTMPKDVPTHIRLLVSKVPEDAKAAVSHAVFPSLASHLHGVYFRYIDNTLREPAFMCVLMAKMSSGKSAVNKPIEYILADIKQRDEVSRQREQAWKDSLNTKGANKEKPKRPDDLCIQILVPDMTNAAFVQRLADAKGRFLYTSMDELELLNNLKTSAKSNQVSQIIRLAFDCAEYGQERVGSQSVTAKVPIRWNWNASATIERGKSFFRNGLTDGTLSRLNFCTIVQTKGSDIPVYGNYDEAFAAELKPYIDALNGACGEISCPEAEELARDLLQESRDIAMLADNEAYEVLSYRANVIAYQKAMVLYVANGCHWDDRIAEFVRWSKQYDMWCKMHFFGQQLQGEIDKENLVQTQGPRNMLEMLPNRFSRDELASVRLAQGKSADPSLQLAQWKKRGFVVQDEATLEYVKTELYLSRNQGGI
mgnify:CR=1 FL=1